MTQAVHCGAPIAIRAAAITFTGDPFTVGASAMHYESDAIVVMSDGRIVDFGAASSVASRLPVGTEVTRYTGCLISAGFIDAHVHYPQTSVIASYGKQLLDWLNDYTFPAEAAFVDPAHASEVARFFLEEALHAGTTSCAAFCTVHPESVDAFFAAAQSLGMRVIAGKVLMDRNAPEALLDSARSGYDQGKALIARWHDRDRLSYCVTPRFAATSSPEQLDAAGALWREHPGTYLQSHIAENRGEIEWVRKLFPERAGYLDVYDHFGLLGPRAIYGHGIWLSESEFARMHDTGTAIAHCPTSNTFLGSGLFRLHDALKPSRAVRVALATDIGGGTRFSMLSTMHEAYKVAQLNGRSLTALQAFYLATRGGARALYMDDRVGSIAPGMEADLVVLDLASTRLIAERMRHCENIEQALFVQMTLGDERSVRATYVAGALAAVSPGRATD
ncbi:MAG: guanine deaminase [Betaproteobacteria bacterium]